MLTLSLDIIWTFVNLIVLFLILKKFLFAPVQKVINEREALINGQMAEAKAKEEEANEKLLAAKRTVDDAAEEAKRKAQYILDMAAEKEKQYIKAAKDESAKILEESRIKAQQDKEKLLADTREEMISIALMAAKKAVGDSIDSKKEQALFDDLVKKVGEA